MKKERLAHHFMGRTIIKIALLFITFWGCSLDSNSVSAPSNENALNILFIGNSLTYENDLPGILAALIETGEAGPAEIVSATYPNFGLMDHWGGAGESRATIEKGGWDVIIMQQGPSATEGRPSLLEYSALFAQEAEKIDATPAIYMVWPSRLRSFDFDGVSESHQMAAENIDGLLFPVGEAWRKAWKADSTLALYASDDFHPSVLGSYLGAAVMFEQLTGTAPSSLPVEQLQKFSNLSRITATTFSKLHAAAEEANETFGREVSGWPRDGN